MKKAIVSGTHRLELQVELSEDKPEVVTIVSKRPSTLTGDNDPWVDNMVNFVRDTFKGAGRLIIVNHETCTQGSRVAHKDNESTIKHAINLCDHLILAGGKPLDSYPAVLANVYYFGINKDGGASVPSSMTANRTGYPHNMALTTLE